MMTVEDVCSVCGINPQTLRNWISGGLVEPAVRGGYGPGRGHGFSVTQAVGLAVAEQLRRSEYSYPASYISLVVAGFAAMAEEELVRRLGRGATHFLLAAKTGGAPVVVLEYEGRYDGTVDVHATYRAVRAKADERLSA